MEENPHIPDIFYCEICRLSRADPYVSSVCVCVCAYPGYVIISKLMVKLFTVSLFGYFLKFYVMISYISHLIEFVLPL